MEKKNKNDDSNKYLVPGSLLILGIFAVVIYLLSHTYALDGYGEINLSCNKGTITQGEEVTCTISGTVPSNNYVSSIYAEVSLSSNLELVSFTSGTGLTGDGTNGKISLYPSSGDDITGTFSIGTVVVRAKTATFNSTETIEINNVKFNGPLPDMEQHEITSKSVNLSTPSFTSSAYNLSNDYIISDTKNIATIIGNISTNNCTVKVSVDNNQVTTGTIKSGSKLLIKYNNATIKEYDILYIESSEHDLTNDYIFTDNEDINTVLSDFTAINGTLSIKNGRVTLTYDGTDVKYYDIIKLNTTAFYLDIENNYLLTSNASTVISNINKSNNVTLSISGENLQVSYNNEVVKTIKIYTISSSNYTIDLDKGYIYTKQSVSLSDLNSNISTNTTLGLSNNKLNIIANNNILQSLDVIYISSTKYSINYTDKYIYTGMDTVSSSITSNINATNATISINNNKLEIYSGNNKVDEYNIASFSVTNCTIQGANIYINSAVTYQTFMSYITLTNTTAKVFNTGNTQMTSGNIAENYVLKIYANNVEKASYTIKVEYLTISQNLDVDTTNNIIHRLDFDTLYSTVLQGIETSAQVIVTDKNSNTVSSSSKVKTGDTITVKLGQGDVTYKVSVLGDVLPDGQLDIRDITALYKYHMHKDQNPLSNEQILAGDVITTSKTIDIYDVAKLYRHYRNVLEEIPSSLKD